MTDSDALRKKIEDMGLKLKYVAYQLGISAYSLQKKINNVTEFKSGEIIRLCKILNIVSLEEREKIFFRTEGD